MTDKPLESVITKPEGKGKEPQKFLYLQLQQERLGDGSGRVAAIVPGRGSTTPAHFIPLTAKLNSISVLGSGTRPRATLSVPSRHQSQGTSIVTVATPRPSVSSPVSVASTRSLLTTTVSVSGGSRPIIAGPVSSIAPKPPKGKCAIRRTASSVVVSSGVAKPVMSPSAATITVLGSGNNQSGASTTVFRPSVTQGSQPHGPVILHTSKVSAPVSTSITANKMSPRLLPMPISQVRSGGVANKAVLSYSAILQAGGGGSGAVSSISTKDNSPLSPQPLVLQGASSTAIKSPTLNKSGPATISIITGKGNKQSTAAGTSTNAVNMVSVNLGQNKPNMINFKISNGQIQTDTLQQVDVLREARPMAQANKHVEDWKESLGVTPNNSITHAINTGSLTVSRPLCSSMTITKGSDHELSTCIVKQPTVIEGHEEPAEIISREKNYSSNLSKSLDGLDDVTDASLQGKFESVIVEEVKSPDNMQMNFSTAFKAVTTISPPVVSVHLPSIDRCQVAITAPHCVTTVHKQPLVSSHQIFTTTHQSVKSSVPHLPPNVHHPTPSSIYQPKDALHPLVVSRDAAALNDQDEILRETHPHPEPPDEQMIYEEVRKEVMGTLMSNTPTHFLSHSPRIHDKYVGDTDREIKEEKDIITEVMKSEEERETLVKIKEENGEEKSTIIPPLESQSENDDVKPELIKFSDLLKWEDGVGKLDGSALKFRMNEFNAVEIVEDGELEELKNHHAKKFESTASRHHARKPNFRELVKDEEIFSDNSQDSEPQGSKSTRESDDICCCKNCGCYGLSSEFFRDSSFCSLACGEEHDARELEWDKERLKQEKERQKRKRLKQEKLGGEQEMMIMESNGSDLEESTTVASEEDSMIAKANVVGSDLTMSKYQCPWLDGRNHFSWKKYLEHCGRSKGLAKAAPLKLWPEPFPFSRNLFRPGMKLEAIDPSHQALFCVMSVAETVGFRIRLHFDCYSDQHDYWTNADSPTLFPVGWCEKNGRQLEPPLGVIGFNWKAYLEHCKGQVAPRHAFVNKGHSTMIPPNNFRVGMKLEAEDRKNLWVCVATVADVIDNRVLIHFDGWDKAYDVWNEFSSPYIHPIGWCASNNVVLHPPNEYPNPESFNWHEYLQETNSMAVPARAFKTRPRREFKVNMKVEAVDKRNPALIRVATVVDVQDYQVKIHFDGWAEEYDYWVDDDSSDLHPPSWCSKTGHRLQIPLTSEQQVEFIESGIGCGTPGCKGMGHIKGPIYTTHHTAFGCPYSSQNLNKDPDCVIPDRLHILSERKKGKMAPRVKIDLRQGLTKKEGDVNEVEETEGQKKRVRKRRKFFDELSPPEPNRAPKLPKITIDDTKPNTIAGIMQSPGIVSEMSAISSISPVPSASSIPPVTTNPMHSLQEPQPPAEAPEQGVDMIVHQSVFNPGYNPHPVAPAPHSWERHRHLTAPLGDAKRSDVETWNADQVQQMVARIPGCEQVSSRFMSEQIDGEALLMMTQNDLVSLLHIKLGPAIKIMAVIMCLKSSV